MIRPRLWHDAPPPAGDPPPPLAPPPDPIAELRASNAALEARLAAQEQENRQAMQAMLQAIQQIGAEPTAPMDDYRTIEAGYHQLRSSNDPRDRYVEALGHQVGQLTNALKQTQAESASLRSAMTAGIPAEDLEACQKYVTSGDAGNLKAAHRLVRLDKAEAAGSSTPIAPAGPAAPQQPAAPPRPSPAAPPITPPAPGGPPGTMKLSEWQRAAAETDERGRPTSRALELIEGESNNRIRLVPG